MQDNTDSRNPPFKLGDRVKVVEEGTSHLKEDEIYAVICMVWADWGSEWACDVVPVEDYTGQDTTPNHNWWAHSFKIAKISNEERMRLRKEQIANG